MTMELGAYTFAVNPAECDIPKLRKRAGYLETYSGVAYFSWGLFLPGQVIEMTWEIMTTTQFDALQTLLENDVQIVWDPENGSTYNVEILSLFGDYYHSAAAAAEYKQNVSLKLLIISEV